MAVAGVVVVADQITKSVALGELHRPTHLIGPLGLALTYNSGSAFSLFAGRAAVLGPVAALAAVVIVWSAWRSRTLPTGIGLGLVLGGAVGNLADRALRAHHGAVVDFITLSHWPTFNVADAAITVGAVLLAISLGRPARRDPAPVSSTGGKADG
jgi:signal peptidase II